MKTTGRFVILMYHMISKPRSQSEQKYACPPQLFAKHMSTLSSKGFSLVGLDTILNYCEGKVTLPSRSLAVTFDDGFRDNYENAFPILKKYRVPATIFLVTNTVGKTNTWMQINDLPSREMLTWQQIHEMSLAGIQFGAHTHTHPRLTELSKESAIKEIEEAKKIIEERTGQPVDFFAYPYGLYNSKTKELVEQTGYSLGCSTLSGFNNQNSDPYIFRRIEVYGNDSPWKLINKINFGTNESDVFLPARYYWSRVKYRISRLFNNKKLTL